MKERPILFSGPMIRAILEGRKTQTRRLVTPSTSYVDGIRWNAKNWARLDFDGRTMQPYVDPGPSPAGNPGPYLKVALPDNDATVHRVYPQWEPGDRLWVRETFTWITGNGRRVWYRADGEPTDRDGNVLPTTPGEPRWRPSLFMPRECSRITLEVTAVRVERLQEITQADAMAEGLRGPLLDRELDRLVNQVGRTPRDAFTDLWNAINGKRAPWSSNPWLWVVAFKRVTDG